MIARLFAILIILMPLAAAAQDTPDCPDGAMQVWGRMLDPAEQSWERREIIDLGEEAAIVAVEFGPLAGEYAKVWLFLRTSGGCIGDAISLGSYAYQERMGIDRAFHLDHYRAASHSTLGFYGEKPTYETVRTIAMDRLAK